MTSAGSGKQQLYFMHMPFNELLAIITLMLWPAIPLFWIPVHCVPRFFRRLGFWTYVLPLITWLPLAVLTFALRDVLLGHRMELPAALHVLGFVLFVAGAGLQVWTLFLLTLPVITGMPEVTRSVQGRLMTRGPFGVVRHPTYLSHTLMLLGVFFVTEVTAIGIVAVIDVFVVNSMVIPLEERELLERFGTEYEEYRRKVPSRFLPLRRAR
jgi:protein-S-isoprenylcysteine O-methyltransferase Ste14